LKAKLRARIEFADWSDKTHHLRHPKFIRMESSYNLYMADLQQVPSAPIGVHVDVGALRMLLRAMNDDELLAFGQQMRDLVYPLTYGADGKPSVSAFSIQLDEVRREWLRRHQGGNGAAA
jgi:hypothetical protein